MVAEYSLPNSGSDEQQAKRQHRLADMMGHPRRITPQFSGGSLTYVTWHFIHDRPLQLLVMRWHSIETNRLNDAPGYRVVTFAIEAHRECEIASSRHLLGGRQLELSRSKVSILAATAQIMRR